MYLLINRMRFPLETPEQKNRAMLFLLLQIDLLSSFDNFKINLLKAVDIGSEFKPRLKKKIPLIRKAQDKNKLLLLYYNLVLYYERMGLCFGFSCHCPIDKGLSNYNPEIKRISKNWLLEKIQRH